MAGHLFSCLDLEKNTLHCLPTQNITISPSESLLAASKLLVENRLHRLPIIELKGDSEVIISVLTQSKILKFIALNVKCGKCICLQPRIHWGWTQKF